MELNPEQLALVEGVAEDIRGLLVQIEMAARGVVEVDVRGFIAMTFELESLAGHLADVVEEADVESSWPDR